MTKYILALVLFTACTAETISTPDVDAEIAESPCSCSDLLVPLDTAAALCPQTPATTCDAGVWTLTCRDGQVTRLRIVSDAGSCNTLTQI